MKPFHVNREYWPYHPQVGSSIVRKEKYSHFKKVLKPHKGVLRLVIERKTDTQDGQSTGMVRPPIPITEVLTPTKSPSSSSHSTSHAARQLVGSTYSGYSYQDSTISEQSAGCTQDSTNSSMPEKMVATGGLQRFVMDGARPVSDGVVYGFNDQRPAYDDDFSEPPSTGYTASESFLSEPSSYDCLPMSSSQTSIELTFHSVSQVSHNRLTVQSTMSTQPKEHSSQDDAYFARDDDARTTFRSRAASEGQATGNSQLPEPDKPYKLSKARKFLRRKKHSKSGSLSQLPTIDTDDYSRGKYNLK